MGRWGGVFEVFVSCYEDGVDKSSTWVWELAVERMLRVWVWGGGCDGIQV